MTEVEEKFYKTFGIEQREFRQCIWKTTTCPLPENECNTGCVYWEIYKTDYPPITDHILLELVCILVDVGMSKYFVFFSDNINDLKEEIIEGCINNADDIKSDVRKLFEE